MWSGMPGTVEVTGHRGPQAQTSVPSTRIVSWHGSPWEDLKQEKGTRNILERFFCSHAHRMAKNKSLTLPSVGEEVPDLAGEKIRWNNHSRKFSGLILRVQRCEEPYVSNSTSRLEVPRHVSQGQKHSLLLLIVVSRRRQLKFPSQEE